MSSFSGLKEYLALPVEEYSLLDPMWIEKLVRPAISHQVPVPAAWPFSD